MKKKGEMVKGRVMWGWSREKKGWGLDVEIVELKRKKWKYVGGVDGEVKGGRDDVDWGRVDMEDGM